MSERSIELRARVALLLVAVVAASCGTPPAEDGINPGQTTIGASGINPGQTTIGTSDTRGDGWTYSVTLDFPAATFENSIDASDYVFTARIVGVAEPRFNTAGGRLGSRADWEGSDVQPFEWQQLDVAVSEVLEGDLDVADGRTLQLICGVAAERFCGFDASAVGASLLVGASDWTIEFLDGSTIDAYDIHPQATYISFPGGPALRLFDVTSGSWHTFGGAAAEMPDETTVDVVRSLDELVERARHPYIPLEEQLGYNQIYGPRDTNPDPPEIVP